MDSVNHGSKISREKIPESSKKQNLNLPSTEHYAEFLQLMSRQSLLCVASVQTDLGTAADFTTGKFRDFHWEFGYVEF